MAVPGLADLEMRFTLELTRISGATQAVGFYSRGASIPQFIAIRSISLPF
jgi:hypothetical protein